MVRPGELTDLDLMPGEFRAFRRDMTDTLAHIANALEKLGGIEQRLDVIIDRQNEQDRRMDAQDRRMDDLVKRVTLLETKPKRKPRK